MEYGYYLPLTTFELHFRAILTLTHPFKSQNTAMNDVGLTEHTGKPEISHLH